MQHSDNAPYTFALSHLPCNAAVFGHQTNCSCTKLHETAVCCRDSRTNSIHRFSPIRENQQETTASPTAITNRNSRGYLTSGNTAVLSVCVCVCVVCGVCVCLCVCVCAEGQYCVAGLSFVYVMLCRDYIQFPGNPSSSHSFLKKKNNLQFRVIKLHKS